MLSVINTSTQPQIARPFNLAANVLALARFQPDKPALQLLHTDHVESWS